MHAVIITVRGPSATESGCDARICDGWPAVAGAQFTAGCRWQEAVRGRQVAGGWWLGVRGCMAVAVPLWQSFASTTKECSTIISQLPIGTLDQIRGAFDSFAGGICQLDSVDESTAVRCICHDCDDVGLVRRWLR